MASAHSTVVIIAADWFLLVGAGVMAVLRPFTRSRVAVLRGRTAPLQRAALRGCDYTHR